VSAKKHPVLSSGADPVGAKQPRMLPGSTTRPCDDHIAWRFELLHQEGAFFGFETLTPDGVRTMIEKVREFESMTLTELFLKGGYPGREYDPKHIPHAEAKAKLADTYADQTKIYRLRCGGAERLWGFRLDNVFAVLWWDPDHEIWSVEKK
jgi:hypothetical protein